MSLRVEPDRKNLLARCNIVTDREVRLLWDRDIVTPSLVLPPPWFVFIECSSLWKMYSSVPPSLAAPRYRNNSTDIGENRQQQGDRNCSEWRMAGESAGAPYSKQFASMVRFGGVGGFFSYPSVQVRKCRPAPRFFTFRQTLMPEFDQPPFYIDRSKRHR
jgi:hypothetical protein